MQNTHSPFEVIEDFISPAKCDKIIEEFGLSAPTVDEKGKADKNVRFISQVDAFTAIKAALADNAPAIEARYNCVIQSFETPAFMQYFENPQAPCEPHGCENSKFVRRKWVKNKDVDLVGYLWLKDYNNGVPLDPRFEVYGGKLEFPSYDFSLLPQKGTLVLFPAGPHFITAISPVLVGSLELVKISIKIRTRDDQLWLYQPSNFAGTYQDWF
jgi:hypothetical protein